jgi:hypothetical protein
MSSDVTDTYESQWIKMVENTFHHCGMSHFWFNEIGNYSPRYVKQAVKLRLLDNFTQSWSTSVNEHNQCTIYRMFKENLILEQYLSRLPYKERITLCKFRCRNHHLPVTRNRFNEGQHNIMCDLCTNRDIGDEFHYMLNCPYFQNERLLYLKQKLFKNANLYTLKNLMNTANVSKQRNLIKFISVIMCHFDRVETVNDYDTITLTQDRSTRSGRRIVVPDRLNL